MRTKDEMDAEFRDIIRYIGELRCSAKDHHLDGWNMADAKRKLAEIVVELHLTDLILDADLISSAICKREWLKNRGESKEGGKMKDGGKMFKNTMEWDAGLVPKVFPKTGRISVRPRGDKFEVFLHQFKDGQDYIMGLFPTLESAQEYASLIVWDWKEEV